MAVCTAWFFLSGNKFIGSKVNGRSSITQHYLLRGEHCRQICMLDVVGLVSGMTTITRQTIFACTAALAGILRVGGSVHLHWGRVTLLLLHSLSSLSWISAFPAHPYLHSTLVPFHTEFAVPMWQEKTTAFCSLRPTQSYNSRGVVQGINGNPELLLQFCSVSLY